MRGGQVKAFGLRLHRGGFGPDRINPEVLDQPHGASGVEPRHMFATEQRDDRPEPLGMEVDQPVAMCVFFFCHAVKDTCGVGKVRAQTLCVASVDPRVVLFGRDREGEDLLFAQITETAPLCEESHEFLLI